LKRLGALSAMAFVKLRFLVLLGWIAAVVWVLVSLPALEGSSSGSLRELLPANTSAVRAEQISIERFSFPLLSRTIVVVRNPRGLPAQRQASLVRLAGQLSYHQLPAYSQIKGALPLSDRVGGPSFARHPGTTMLLYLFFPPSVSTSVSTQVAQRLVAREIGHRPGEYEGVTGEVPATVAEQSLINSRLLWVGLATILLVALAVGVRFRAVPAALLTAVAVVAAYLVADRVVARLARVGGVTVPAQAQPVLIVLVFGVTTDYAVFFLSRFRALLRDGVPRQSASVQVVREITPIVFTAGITVAAAAAALLAATLAFVRGFGPALAIAALVGMLAAITLVPAALAVAGEWMFWPGVTAPTDATAGARGPGRRRRWRGRLAAARLAGRHPVIAVMLSLAIIVAAWSGLRHMAVSNDLIRDLPGGSEVHRAYDVASNGLAPGALAPVVVVVTGNGVGGQTTALARLQRSLAQTPGVSLVLGPDQTLTGLGARASVWRTGNAARYALFLNEDPLGSRAIAAVRALERSLPSRLQAAGLTRATGMVAGDTAISADIVDATTSSLEHVIPVMLALIFVVIAIYLRALVAPIYLVLSSVLAAGAALGVTAYAMPHLFGYGQTMYYVVLTVAVMLIALGSDYNVFLVGRIWQQKRRGTLSETVATAGARASRSIATAAFVLALSFALLAIVPLRSFFEIAFAMAIGLLIDAFVVRALLVPALLVLVGPRSAWPGSGLRKIPTVTTAESESGVETPGAAG
jgi:putative drug exporter of the RND superfamily